MTKEFIALLEKDNEDKMIAFLKTLTTEQKKELTPELKKLSKHFNEFGPIGPKRHGAQTYGHIRGTHSQRYLIQLASFVCFNRADYEKSDGALWILDREKLLRIVDWYCPAWLGDFINKSGAGDFLPGSLDYDSIMELSERGILQPGTELIVKALLATIFHQRESYTFVCDPQPLLKRPITLGEHIWYLFEVESNLHSSDRYLNFGNAEKPTSSWMNVMKTFTEEGHLPRSRVLQESLLASNRNFNKVLSGWFAELFAELDPKKEELLQLQQELFGVLGAPHSKPVNTALQAIKKILPEKEFKAGIFIDMVPVLLSSDTKSVVSAALIMLEKLAQKQAAYRGKIVLMVCQCFISMDEDIQSRAAKLIGKFGDPKDDALRQDIFGYEQGMRSSARQLLAAFFDGDSPEQPIKVDESAGSGSPASPEALMEIAFPGSIDDLAFLASQAFDDNEIWHVDLLPSALVQFGPRLKAQDIPLLEPAFQRSLKLVKRIEGVPSHLTKLLALFFIDFGNWLIRKYPDASEGLKAIYEVNDTTINETRTSYLVQPDAGSYTATWQIPKNFAFYEPYKLLLLGALNKIRQGDDRSLLSTPTHAPCWISPEALVKRLEHYRDAGKEPDSMDLQVAISRCYLSDTAAALEHVKERFTGEFYHMLVFLFDAEAVPKGPFQHAAAWMVASLSRNNKKQWPAFESFSYSKTPFGKYTGDLKWQVTVQYYKVNEYDYKTKKNVQKTASRKALIPARNPAGSNTLTVKKFFSRLLSTGKDDEPMLYDFMHYNAEWLFLEVNDIKRILSLCPNNPASLLADTIAKCLVYSEFPEEGGRKMVINVAQFLYETKLTSGEMGLLFLGACLLSVDKSVINTAGEIWLKEVSAGNLDNEKLGVVIGTIENLEFAPLKRFTDLLAQQLFRVSPLHDRQLQLLIEHIIPGLPDEPIRNLKKLLEIYIELLAVNKAMGRPPAVLAKFKSWERNAGLKKIL